MQCKWDLKLDKEDSNRDFTNDATERDSGCAGEADEDRLKISLLSRQKFGK